MDCYKFVINEGEHGIEGPWGSKTLLFDILKKLFNNEYKQELGFKFQENNTFPKEYFFVTTENWILNKIKSAYQAQKSDFPPITPENEHEYGVVGNGNLFPAVF